MNDNSYRMIAEWEPQSAILLTWPHAHSDWLSDLDNIESLYVELCRHILTFQNIILVVYDQALQKRIKTRLDASDINDKNINYVIAKTNDTWTRDYGPLFLKNQDSFKLMDFTFDGWGNKYEANLDNNINSILHDSVFTQSIYEQYNFVLEGGSIDYDGNGSLLTSSQCLLNQNRNPLFSKENIESHLESTLHINRIHWIDHGHLIGDDTDSHIDILARFSNSKTLIHHIATDKSDDHFHSLLQMEKQLSQLQNCANQHYELVPLPLPKAMYDGDGKRLAASYANFLIINDAVLVPIYQNEKDDDALNILQDCFPNRNIIGIPFLAAVQQNGSLHCLTMQIPKGI